MICSVNYTHFSSVINSDCRFLGDCCGICVIAEYMYFAPRHMHWTKLNRNSCRAVNVVCFQYQCRILHSLSVFNQLDMHNFF